VKEMTERNSGAAPWWGSRRWRGDDARFGGEKAARPSVGMVGDTAHEPGGEVGNV
jgi:hypothetical protein